MVSTVRLSCISRGSQNPTHGRERSRVTRLPSRSRRASGSVCEQLRGTAGDRRDPLPCMLNTIIMRAISDDRWNLPAT
jgi:hypothetical protein